MICDCPKPLTGIDPDDDIGGECSRCGGEILEEDIEFCPQCGEVLEMEWDNSGWTEPEGPSHWEIVSVKCLSCGYTDK